jgi:hypothetical protein
MASTVSSSTETLERPEANAVERRHEHVSPARDRGPTHLLGSERPEHRLGRPSSVVAVVAHASEIAHRGHAKCLDEMLLLRAPGTPRVERPPERDLGRGGGRLVEALPVAGSEPGKGTEEVVDPSLRGIGDREADGKVEADELGLLRIEKSRRVGHEAGREGDPTVIDEARFRGPALVG